MIAEGYVGVALHLYLFKLSKKNAMSQPDCGLFDENEFGILQPPARIYYAEPLLTISI